MNKLSLSEMLLQAFLVFLVTFALIGFAQHLGWIGVGYPQLSFSIGAGIGNIVANAFINRLS